MRYTDHPDLSGLSIGEYNLERLLVSTRFSQVYQATKWNDTQRYLYHRLCYFEFSSPLMSEFFLHIKAVSDRAQPSLPTLLESGWDNLGSQGARLAGDVLQRSPYWVSPYFEGESVEQVILSSGKRSPGDSLLLLKAVTRALLEAQPYTCAQSLHPGNILLGERGLLLLGVGDELLRRFIDRPAITRLPERITRVSYYSPEELREQEQTEATLVYRLGALWYFLLTAQAPFASLPENASQIALYIASGTATLAPSGSLSLAPWPLQVLQTMTQPKKERRHQSLQDVLTILKRLSPEGDPLIDMDELLGGLRGSPSSQAEPPPNKKLETRFDHLPLVTQERITTLATKPNDPLRVSRPQSIPLLRAVIGGLIGSAVVPSFFFSPVASMLLLSAGSLTGLGITTLIERGSARLPSFWYFHPCYLIGYHFGAVEVYPFLSLMKSEAEGAVLILQFSFQEEPLRLRCPHAKDFAELAWQYAQSASEHIASGSLQLIEVGLFPQSLWSNH